jgi:hypothetical protein
VQTSAEGSFAEVLSVPSSIEVGAHKVQFIGKKMDGSDFVFAIGVTVVDENAMMMNRAGTMSAAHADNLADSNVLTIGTMSSEDAAKVLLWFLVILILVAGLVAAQPTRRGVAVSPMQRIDAVTPWLTGFTVPRLLMILVGALAGFGAANSTAFAASVPSTVWVAIVIMLGVFDVVAGSTATILFALAVIANGSVESAIDVRVLVLVMLLGFLPSMIARAVRPLQANLVVSSVVSVAMHAVVTLAVLEAITPISGMKYDVANSHAELLWLVALAVVGRKVLLHVTGSTDDHRPSALPWVRLIGAVSITAFVAGSYASSVWTLTASVVLIGVVVLGLRIRVGLLAPSAARVFVGAVASVVVLVVLATGALSPVSENEQITGATSAIPVGDLNVIGKLDVMIDGYPRIFVAVNTGVGELTFINGAVGQSLTIDSQTQGGERIALSADNTLQLVRGQRITINANGYAVDESMNAWLYSDPVLVGNASTDGRGNVKSRFQVPAGPADGDHTLQIRLLSADGKVVNFAIPVKLLSEIPGGAA